MPRVSFEGKIYALPNESNGHLLFYRKDLLDAAGLAVPKTMDEYLNIVTKLTTNERSGMVLQLRRPVGLQNSFSYFLWSAGSDYLDKDWNPIFNNEKGI
jgi:multiple sugar transport system substrate-binding protein